MRATPIPSLSCLEGEWYGAFSAALQMHITWPRHPEPEEPCHTRLHHSREDGMSQGQKLLSTECPQLAILQLMLKPYQQLSRQHQPCCHQIACCDPGIRNEKRPNHYDTHKTISLCPWAAALGIDKALNRGAESPSSRPSASSLRGRRTR